MKVDNANVQTGYQKRIAQKQRNLIASKEEEIKNLNNLYNKKISQTRLEGEINLMNEKEQNELEVNEALMKKESHLVKIRDDMKATAQSLEKQKQDLTQTMKEQISSTNQVFDEKVKSIHHDNMLVNQDIAQKTNTQIKDIELDSKRSIQESNQEARLLANNISRSNDLAIKDIEFNAKTKQDFVQAQQEEQLKFMNKEHEQKVLTEKRANEIDFNQRANFQKAELKNLEVHHKDILNQRRESFKEKHDLMVKNHSEILTRVKSKFDSEIKGLVDKYSEFKNQTLNKIQDKFYNVSKLNPKVVETKDFYDISIQVPEHEKELVNLTAQERNLNMSLTRKFSQDVNKDAKNDASVQHKTKRSEVIATNFKVGEILDSKSVKRSYQDGVLTFRIDKL